MATGWDRTRAIPGHPSPAAARMAWYFYRLDMNDGVKEFCVANAADPATSVASRGKDGKMHVWARRVEGDLLIFTPHADYVEGDWFGLQYDKTVQRCETAPPEIRDREALRNAVSVNFG